MMTEFYKEKFQTHYTKKMQELKKQDFALWQQKVKSGGLNSTSLDEVIVLVNQFAVELFGSQLFQGDLMEEEKQQITFALMMIVFSHRFSKGDKFMLEAEAAIAEGRTRNKIDFSVIRDVMYKYSKKAQERYISYPI